MRGRAAYVPLEVGFWDDPKIVAAGEGAASLYLRMLCYAKANQTDGMVPWAVMRRWGDPKTVRRRAEKLHSVGVCEAFGGANGRADAYNVTAFLRHNRPAAEVAELSRKRRSAAIQGVHARAGEASKLLPLEGSKTVPPRARGKVEVEVINPQSQPVTQDGRGPSAEIGEDLATQLLGRLGYQRQAVDSGFRRYVDRCLSRGWSAVQLGELADGIAERSDLAEPRQYLLAALKQRANSDPATADGEAWADAWATVRRVTARGSHSYSQAQGLSADAARAANEVRQVIRFEPEHVARLAFRQAFMGRNGHRSAA